MKRSTKMAIAGAAATVGGVGFTWSALGMPQLGASAAGERLARMQDSPNFHEGKARNLVQRPMGAAREGASTTVRYFQRMGERTPAVEIPVAQPDLAAIGAGEPGLRVTWLGHSASLLEIDGHLLLTDPMLGERASPVSWAGPSRFHAPPVQVVDLPELDAVLISHDHFDHLDHGTVLALAQRPVRFLVPLGVGAHLEAWGVDAQHITELDWWEETQVGQLRLVCTPAHHFSGRGLFDRDHTLWSSWAVLGPRHRVWFSGDTGPLDAAAEIAARFGPFDLTMLEVGAYDPAWASIHLGPDAAAELHREVGGRVLMPIHWGSFNLALHAWDQPILRLMELAEQGELALLAPLPGQRVEARAQVDAFWRGRSGEVEVARSSQ